jgi:hypothetical protein
MTDEPKILRPDASALKPDSLNLRKPAPRKGAKKAAKRKAKAKPEDGAPRHAGGRPTIKPEPPRTAHQERLAAIVEETEAERDAAARAYRTDPTVKAELLLLRSDMGLASAWGAYCRATGNLTQGTKFLEIVATFAGRIAALRELLATDLLAEIEARNKREDALSQRQ